MSNTKEQLQKAKEQSERQLKALKSEPYQVELQIPSQPNIIRLTYKNINSPILIAVEELNKEGKPITYSSIKGRRIEGNVPELLTQMVTLFRFKPENWKYNQELFLEGYYKQH